jgi:hypothetical protein
VTVIAEAANAVVQPHGRTEEEVVPVFFGHGQDARAKQTGQRIGPAVASPGNPQEDSVLQRLFSAKQRRSNGRTQQNVALSRHAACVSSSAAGRSRMWPSSLTSSKRTETCFVTPDSCIVTP